ncbi:MAG: hypothetical protein WCE90_04080 [Candidatus Zixiibacteriota bacterium]
MEAPDSIRYRHVKPTERKNPYLALALAAIPGFGYHGVGHWYAGETNTAMAIFGAECVGMALIGLAMGDISPEKYDQMTEEEKDRDDRRRDECALAGGIIFLGSWVFDMVDAPLAAKRHNRKLLEKQNIGFKFSFNQKYHSADFQTYVSF